MTDYDKLVDELRKTERICRDRMDGQVMLDAADAIEALQAQLPKRGNWVEGDARSVTARCSVCGHLRLGNGAEWANKHVHFCEVCGSRMGGEKE